MSKIIHKAIIYVAVSGPDEPSAHYKLVKETERVAAAAAAMLKNAGYETLQVSSSIERIAL